MSLKPVIILKKSKRLNEFDFSNSNQLIQHVLENITALKLSGIDLVLGKIFDEIGFNKIEDNLFKDLVLYRLVYPKSKLKTTEYLYRFSQKQYSEDDIYRYMDKLHNKQKDIVQQISFDHTRLILGSDISVVFYDVTTVYFESDNESELRKTGFSKEGKHQNRERGLKKLEKQIKTGKLAKASINNRGYNKYLKLEGELKVVIDKNKFKQDAKWDGLKSYITNAKLSKDEILENYNHLWQIEKAFRTAKTDLQIRPIYHRKKQRIEAHICQYLLLTKYIKNWKGS